MTVENSQIGTAIVTDAPVVTDLTTVDLGLRPRVRPIVELGLIPVPMAFDSQGGFRDAAVVITHPLAMDSNL